MTPSVDVRRIEISEIPRNWHWIAQLLKPAVCIEKTPAAADAELSRVERSLVAGSMGIASLHYPNCAGLVVIQPGLYDGISALWLSYIVGRLKAGPKQWLRVIRSIAAHFERMAKEAGCSEVRIGGRNWAPVLPGYERFDGQPFRLRKVL